MSPYRRQLFRVVVADCPWLFGDKLPGDGRGAEKHYPCMPTEDICRLALPPIADDAVLFFWEVAAMPQDALDVIRAWDFTPKTRGVWVKTTNDGAGLAFGMGHQVRACHETFIIATRGKVKPNNRSTRSVFITYDEEGDFYRPDGRDLVLTAPRGRHSEKPQAFYDLVTTMYDGPRVELFARQERPGFTCIGNELGTTLSVASSIPSMFGRRRFR